MNIHKARGLSSHQVVGRVRRILGQKRVGHAGTLDPLAEGVLPVCVGRATRLADWVADGDKVYYAEIELGITTSTDDLEGEVLSQRPVPMLDDEAIGLVLNRFVGRVEQRPPAFSAIKTDGVPAYRRARRGQDVALRPRVVEIQRIDLLAHDESSISILVRCGKGTYIRALARDVGEILDCGATLRRLIRLRVGQFDISSALSLDELQERTERSETETMIQPMDQVLDTLPAVVLDEHRALAAGFGQAWAVAQESDGWVRAYRADGQLVGLLRSEPALTDDPHQWSWRLRRLLTEA